MTHVRVNNTLGTEGSLVSFAVRVDLKMRVFLAIKNPGSRRGGPSFHGVISGDELVVSCSSWPEVCLLASRAKVQVTVLAIVGRLILLASLTLQIIGIHRFLLD